MDLIWRTGKCYFLPLSFLISFMFLPTIIFSITTCLFTFFRWCQFDAVMAFFILLSVILQTFEILEVIHKNHHWTMLRSPRPLIMIRMIRVFLKFPISKSRINQIFKRSSHQIYNVTIFFLFFMTFYGLWGVQFFGDLNFHCVRKGVTADKVTLNDLTIPDSYCNPHGDSGGHR